MECINVFVLLLKGQGAIYIENFHFLNNMRLDKEQSFLKYYDETEIFCYSPFIIRVNLMTLLFVEKPLTMINITVNLLTLYLYVNILVFKLNFPGMVQYRPGIMKIDPVPSAAFNKSRTF